MYQFSSITSAKVLAILKEIVLDQAVQAGPGHADELEELRAQLDAGIDLASPLAELGWDSVRLTWLLVRLEERFDIDTSTLSLFDLFTVGDLVEELLALIEKRAA